MLAVVHMPKFKRSLFVVFLSVSGVFSQTMHYSLKIDDEFWKFYHVRIDIQGIDAKRLVFSMPIWVPGTYFVGDYGENVYAFEAENESGNPLRVEKLSKSDWEVQTDKNSRITVTYDVKASERNFIGEGLDSTGALIEGAATWMYVRGCDHLPVTVSVNSAKSWQVATALPPAAEKDSYSAKDYNHLADCPIFIGELQDTTIYVLNKPHEIYFKGQADFSLSQFAAMVGKIVAYQAELFNGLPYERYHFLYTLLPELRGGGGLEHATSTSIGIPAIRITQDVESAASLTAHEFFHLWNVKRITSDKLLPMRYDKDVRFESLWWLEGVTSYYADLTLVRSGIWTVREFLDELETEIEVLQENPDRLQTTLAQASWNAWEKGPMSIGISYYNKGKLTGLLLDLMMRKLTKNQFSLDKVLLYLWENYGQQNCGFEDGDIQKIVESLSGKDFSPFFDRYIHGLVELPLKEILPFAGIDVEIEKKGEPSIGTVRLLGIRNRIFSIDPKGAAAKAGLRRNDFLLAIDDQKIESRDQFADYITKRKVGEIVKLTAERDGAQMDFFARIENFNRIHCTLKLNSKTSEEQSALLNSWLRSTN